MKIESMFLLLTATLALMPAAVERNPETAQLGPRSGPQRAAAARVKSAPEPVQIQMLDGLPAGWTALKNISNNTTDSEVAVGAVDAKSNAYCVWTEWHGGVGAQRDIAFTTNKSGSWAMPFSWSVAYPDIDDVGFPALGRTRADGRLVECGAHTSDRPGFVVLGHEHVGLGRLENGQGGHQPTLQQVEFQAELVIRGEAVGILLSEGGEAPVDRRHRDEGFVAVDEHRSLALLALVDLG